MTYWDSYTNMLYIHNQMGLTKLFTYSHSGRQSSSVLSSIHADNNVRKINTIQHIIFSAQNWQITKSQLKQAASKMTVDIILGHDFMKLCDVIDADAMHLYKLSL